MSHMNVTRKEQQMAPEGVMMTRVFKPRPWSYLTEKQDMTMPFFSWLDGVRDLLACSSIVLGSISTKLPKPKVNYWTKKTALHVFFFIFLDSLVMVDLGWRVCPRVVQHASSCLTEFSTIRKPRCFLPLPWKIDWVTIPLTDDQLVISGWLDWFDWLCCCLTLFLFQVPLQLRAHKGVNTHFQYLYAFDVEQTPYTQQYTQVRYGLLLDQPLLEVRKESFLSYSLCKACGSLVFGRALWEEKKTYGAVFEQLPS